MRHRAVSEVYTMHGADLPEEGATGMEGIELKFQSSPVFRAGATTHESDRFVLFCISILAPPFIERAMVRPAHPNYSSRARNDA